MTTKEYFEKVSETLNNKIVLNDFKYKGLNWVHAIRIIIFNFEYEKYLSNNTKTALSYETKQTIEQDISSNPQNIDLQKLILVQKKSTRKKTTRIFRKIKKIYTQIYELKKLIRFYFKAKYLKIINYNVINFTLDNFDVKYDNKYFNPYSDNINLNEKAFNLCFILIGNKEQLKYSYFKPYKINHLFEAYCHLKLNKINADTDFLNPLKEVFDEETFNYIGNNVQEVFKYYLFFTFIIKAIKPKKIFLYNSYCNLNLGLIAACKKLKVFTIEQQHGIIYPLHLGYCYNYSNFSQTDFLTNQLHYYSKPLIDWTKTNWSFNPDLIELKESPAHQIWVRFKEKLNNLNLQKLQLKIGNKKVITFGLSNDKLPEWLIEAIERLKDNYFFCFRFHPRYLDNNQVHISELQKKTVNSDAEFCSLVSLYDLFEISNYFLSEGSTTLIDALPFNLKSICYSAQYADIVFQPYINQKLILLATNFNELNEILTS